MFEVLDEKIFKKFAEIERTGGYVEYEVREFPKVSLTFYYQGKPFLKTKPILLNKVPNEPQKILNHEVKISQVMPSKVALSVDKTLKFFSSEEYLPVNSPPWSPVSKLLIVNKKERIVETETIEGELLILSYDGLLVKKKEKFYKVFVYQGAGENSDTYTVLTEELKIV